MWKVWCRMTARRSAAWLLSLWCVVSLASCGDAGGSGHGVAAFDPVLAAQLQARLEQSRAQFRGLGSVAGVRTADGAVWLGASGSATVDGSVPMAASDRFRVASVTKMFTAALVFLLVEDGRLLLDDPIDVWYPALPEAGQITIRMLLGHTSGIADYFDLVDQQQHWEPDALIQAAVAGGLLDPPGEAFHYSDTNYVLLARIVEKITASTYRTELRRRLLDPLLLDDTFLEGEEQIPGGIVQGARLNGDAYEDISDAIDPSLGWAAGGLVSTASDLLRWTEALFGGHVLRRQSLDAMLAPATLNDGTEIADSGHGVDIAMSPAGARYGHLGGLGGFASSVFDLPDREISIVVLSNSQPAAWFVAEDLWDVVLAE